ncbi:MAG: hypothetical protein MPW15_12500 [Candidatus Manganitrophus sp.]|nr:hypothetical protein [Candidatus Manganitrophus sp.]
MVIRIGRSRRTDASITASPKFFPVFLHLVGELDDQDAVLGDQPDQHHQPDLAVDVERAAGEPERQERAGHRQRHGEHDDERIDEALELRGEHEVDEGQREHESNIKRWSRTRGIRATGRRDRRAHVAGRISAADFSRNSSASPSA